jgi:cobyric acid synthase
VVGLGCAGPAARGEGALVGDVFGMHWHGAFETDGFRRAFLTWAARLAGRHGSDGTDGPSA